MVALTPAAHHDACFHPSLFTVTVAIIPVLSIAPGCGQCRHQLHVVAVVAVGNHEIGSLVLCNCLQNFIKLFSGRLWEIDVKVWCFRRRTRWIVGDLDAMWITFRDTLAHGEKYMLENHLLERLALPLLLLSSLCISLLSVAAAGRGNGASDYSLRHKNEAINASMEDKLYTK